MKIPRDLSGRELSALLRREFGYEISRQRGSHIRLSTEHGGVHHVTIPDHIPLKIGTLAAILSEVAEHRNLSKEQVFEALFG